MKRGADGSIVAAPIWNYYMANALKNTPVESFTKPQPIVTGKPVLDGQVMSGREIKIDSMSGKLATQYTPSSTIKTITTGEIHDILFYVNKDDPRGPQPTNPADDPQYTAWETGVRAWAIKQGLSPDGTNSIPTDYDNIHLPEDQPNLDIISPSDKATIKDPSMTVSISASSKRGIVRTEYYIDGSIVSAQNGPAQDTNIDLTDFESGWHTLTVSVKDDLQNTTSKSEDFNLVLSGYVPTLNFTSPVDGLIIKKFPASIKGELTNLQKIKQIDIYYRSATSTADILINTLNPTASTFSTSWKTSPGPGDYIITSDIINNTGKKYNGDQINVTVQ
jgi:hypothetical protein